MHKMITIFFIFLLLLIETPVYAGSSFLYTRLIETDNLNGFKSVVLDKDVYTHSNQLNDLRVLNNKDEEVPYFIASIHDAFSETVKESFILSEEAQYVSSQEGTDTIITIQVDHLNAFRLELNTDDMIERTYGLFGVNAQSTHYLSEGELSNLLPSDSSMNTTIEWTNNPPIDKLRLIIHNRKGNPINLKSVTVYYHLNKLIFKDPGDGQLRLAYGNDALRFPIYEGLNFKATLKSESVTQAELGVEVKSSLSTDTSRTPTKYKLLSNSMLTVLVLLMLFVVGTLLKKKNK